MVAEERYFQGGSAVGEAVDRTLGDRYVLDSALGEGGMARVFRGTMRGADSPVAVKILRSSVSERDPELAQAFLRNRRVLTSVSHTNLVKIIDVVKDGDTLGVIMELIEGESLADYLSRVRKLPLGAVLPLFKQIMLGLSELHASGITHGDLKPNNILLDNSTGSLVVKITDFGPADTERETLQDGLVFGTPRYMAPEVRPGAAAGPAADMYSAGIVLYEMLAGHVPFTGGTHAVFSQHQYEKPAPIAELAGDKSGTWILLSRLLAKNPSERPSVFVVLAELEETSSHVPVQLLGAPPGPAKAPTSARRSMTRASAWSRPKGRASYPSRWHTTRISRFRDEREPAGGSVATSWTRLASLASVSPNDRVREFPAQGPRSRLREEAIEHAEGNLYRFDVGFDEFLIVDRLGGNGTLNWTTRITPGDFVTLVQEHLADDDSGKGRVTIGLNGIIDEMGAEIGVALAHMGGSSFNRECEFFRFDRDDLTLAYQVLPTSGSNRRTPVFGISAPRLTVERVLPLLVLTGTEQLLAHTLSMRADALPPRLALAMSARKGPRSRAQPKSRAPLAGAPDTPQEESGIPTKDSRG